MEVKPAILSPVARCIGVSNAHSIVSFYRDILGFEIGENEATYGPARLEFGESQPGGSAILFFEVADANAMLASIQARGGSPSHLGKVNWIKFQAFQIIDPEGNILWFGESFNYPKAEKGGMIRQALPELPFTNVPAAVVYYRDVLGFKINYQQHDLGVMDRDKITILLIQRTDRHTGIGSFGTYIENADALCAELRAKGANVLGGPVSYPWGLRNFQVLDLEGNRITFSQTFE